MDENVLETVSKISEFNELKEFMDDEDIDEALNIIIQLIMKPQSANPGSVQRMIVKTQALSAKFGVLASFYSTVGRDKAGTPNNHKKNVYYSLHESFSKICDSLKYVAKLA